MITRRLLLKWFASILAICLTPWRGSTPGLRDAAQEGLRSPATSQPYEDVIVLDQTRDGKGGVKINGNQVFYPGWRKVVFNSKDYGVVTIDSRKRKVVGDAFLERFEELAWKELSKS